MIGYLTAPGDWYTGLTKPFFNPPGWVFGPVWTVLYVIIAYVGWRVWTADRQSNLVKLWFVQMGLNFLWSPVFFAAQMPAVALVVILLLWAAIAVFIKIARAQDNVSALLFMPYIAWVTFASALNSAIVVLNPTG